MTILGIARKIWPVGLGARLMDWLKTGGGAIGRGIAALVASVLAFVASPKVWAAGVLFFVTGWVAAFSVGHVPHRPKPADSATVQRLEGHLAAANGKIAALTSALTSARTELAAAEKRAAEAEEAAKAAPKVVYRSRPAPKKPAEGGVTFNWPKLP